MPLTSLGDMSQFFLSQRNNFNLKSELRVLSEELATGQAQDLTKHLSGDRTRLADLDRRLAILDSYSRTSGETVLLFSTAQTTLGTIDDRLSQRSQSLVLLTQNSPEYEIGQAALAARQTFEDIVRDLNTRIAGRSLFAGKSVDQAALAQPDEMMSDILTAIGAASTAEDIILAIDNWFDAPAGGFETIGFLGDTGDPISRTLGDGSITSLDVKANDPALRDVLKGAVLAAVLNEPSLTLAHSERASLIRESGLRLIAAGQTVAQLRARVGMSEAEIDQSISRTSAQKTALGILRNDMVSIDPFETATKLQQVQIQLETHYTITARLSRLTLAEYLR